MNKTQKEEGAAGGLPPPRTTYAVRLANLEKARAAKERLRKERLEKAVAEKGAFEKYETATEARSQSPRAHARIKKQIRQVLMTLLDEKESGAVRIAAAKALTEQIEKREGDDEHDDRRAAEERAAAIDEARALLDSLAIAKSGRVSRAGKVA